MVFSDKDGAPQAKSSVVARLPTGARQQQSRALPRMRALKHRTLMEPCSDAPAVYIHGLVVPAVCIDSGSLYRKICTRVLVQRCICIGRCS